MNIVPTLVNSIMLLISLGTIGSLLVHDTNVDKATITALSAKTMTEVAAPGNMPHTHSERNSLYQAVRDLRVSQPRIQPRGYEDKKFIQNKQPRGYHPFDNYTLPMIG